MPIDQEGLYRAGDVGEIGGIHQHPGPLGPLGQRLVLACQKASDRLALMVDDPALLLQPLENQVRMHLAVVGKDNHVFAVKGDRFCLRRLDYDGRVVAFGFLEPGVAVIPIRPGLNDREVVDEGLAGLDTGEAYARHTVHVGRHKEAVPVDRGLLVQGIGDGDPGLLPLLEAQHWTRDRAIDGHRMADLPIDGDRRVANREFDVLARQRRKSREATLGAHRPVGEQRADRSACTKNGALAQKGAAIEIEREPGHQGSLKNERPGVVRLPTVGRSSLGSSSWTTQRGRRTPDF